MSLKFLAHPAPDRRSSDPELACRPVRVLTADRTRTARGALGAAFRVSKRGGLSRPPDCGPALVALISPPSDHDPCFLQTESAASGLEPVQSSSSTVLANPGSRAGSGWAHLGPQGLLSAPVCPGCELLVPEGRYGEGVRPTDRPRLLDARNSYSRAPPTPLFPFGVPPGAAAEVQHAV